MPFRKLVFWIHLACGLAAGTVILMMSVTGVLLTYQKQMTEWSDRAYWVPPEVEGGRASLSRVISAAGAHAPNADVTRVSVYSDRDAPVAASLSGGRTLYLDPSTATVRGEANPGMRSFFSTVMRWHRWFNVTGDGRANARAITGWSNIVFLFLVLSGLYLWFPRRWGWQHLRPILLYNREARGKARDFNWHHVFGFWMSIPLAIVVASATVISFPWASDLAYRVTGDTPPVRRAASSEGPASTSRPETPARPPAAGAASVLGSPSSAPLEMPDASERSAAPAAPAPTPFDIELLDPLLEPAMTRLDEWRTITVTIPEESGTPVEFRIEQGWGGEPQKRHTLTFDGASASELSYVTFRDQSPGRRFRTFLRFAHTGEYFGVGGQTIAGIASLAAVFLVWSGFALAWRRLMRPLLKRLAAA